MHKNLASNAPIFVCGRGFAPDPTGGAYYAPPDPLVGFARALCALRALTFEGLAAKNYFTQFLELHLIQNPTLTTAQSVFILDW